jgi:hypothetical protein
VIQLEILKTLSIDLSGKQNAPVVYAVQGEKNSRKIRFDLFNGGVQWVIDRTASVLISYKKPDGHGGMYDVLDSGESAFEFVENSTNSVIITLAKQVLTTVGNVPLLVSFMVGDEILSTFSIVLDVCENPGIDVAESEDYFSLSVAIDAAKKVVGEMLDPEAFASKEYVDGLATDIREEIEDVSNNSKVFYVTFLETDGTFSADKSVPVIADAKQNGRSIKALVEYSGDIISVPLVGIIEEDTAYYAGYGIYGTYVVISQTDIKVSVFVYNLDCGIHPVAKTEDMTQPVGVDELGGLWSVPGTGGGNNEMELIAEGITTEEARSVLVSLDTNGQPFELEDYYMIWNAKTNSITGNGAVNGHYIVHSYEKKQPITGVYVCMRAGDTLSGNTEAWFYNIGQIACSTKGIANKTGMNIVGNVALSQWISRPITGIAVSMNGAYEAFASGATYKLYGRRCK